MRYWDSSALVPIVVDEGRSALARSWLEEDGFIATWAWTQVELSSAIERRAHHGDLTRQARQASLEQIATLATDWDEVADLQAVRRRALRLLARHPLRAADAVQLAAALFVAEDDPASLVFVCLDERLITAAEREGFPVLGADDGREAARE